MEVDVIKLTDEQIAAWKYYDLDSYDEYQGLYDEEAGGWSEVPEWMIDNDPTTGPFEVDGSVIVLNPSWGTTGW